MLDIDGKFCPVSGSNWNPRYLKIFSFYHPPPPFQVPHIFRGTVKNWKWYCLVIGATSDRVTFLFLFRGGFLISPKWKNFRSQKLQFAEKTRLNNAIWRCWHIQCEYKKYVFQKINRIECLTMWSLWMWIRMLVFFRRRGWLSSHHPFTVVLSCDWMHLWMRFPLCSAAFSCCEHPGFWDFNFTVPVDAVRVKP